MKKFTKILSLILALTLCLSFPVGASASEIADPAVNALIDESASGSITIYKYDLSRAEKDGIWDSSYVSTGVYDQTGVNDILGTAVPDGDTDNKSDHTNGQVSYGYAINGVEFTYLRVADIIQYRETDENGGSHQIVLYGFDKASTGFLNTIGLSDGAGRFEAADTLEDGKIFYESDTIIDALAAALKANSTTVKNALEAYIAEGGTAMPLTDAYGKTQAADLKLGLYLLVETAVPEMVVSTTDPFLISVPMTSVNGTNASDGGTRWIYDVTVYPKNLTGIPTLEKTLRENAQDTGDNDGSSNIGDGYAHTGTASAGDTIDYQIVSTLPSITSDSTYLSCYTFIDTLSRGLTYTKGDVVLEFFSDTDCTAPVAKWTEADGLFQATYSDSPSGESVMTIQMTEKGLAEINTSKAVYSEASMVNSGYSDCTLRITYTAKMDSDHSLVIGNSGNPNKVVLTWQRTSSNYYDTLVDDCHLYTYGIDLTKLFSDGKGDFSDVQFIVANQTDEYYVKAELNQEEGVYYVVDHVTEAKEATRFVPVAGDNATGKVIIKGMEDDSYTVTEIKTANGYTLLKDDIEITISTMEHADFCDIYGTDVLGLIQNDPRYAEIINDASQLKNVPQAHLEHHLLTATAKVDSKEVTMQPDNGSDYAEVPLTVVNTRGFDLPETGDHGTMMFTVCGILIMAAAAGVLFIATRKKKS